ncbi:beta-lactamase-like protein [Exophiala viscosa]|uniref:Beta-lactamase-like protein n=1 Tax=Exophiala viscosa TaxID=2486360 RepID=A0AAN6DZA0_9EURO|nr:beta-lactamase-like protein [Exophiala viscosa]
MASSKRFAVPEGAVAQVRIIDSTTSIKGIETEHLMGPAMPGMPVMPEIPTWSFLVESKTGRKALFDLGVPPNWRDFSPAVTERLFEAKWEISGEKHVADILRDEGVDLSSINSIVWSHWHWDHLGDPSTFPGSTEVVVGPGFKEAFFPGYPAKQDSPVRESDFAGRDVREISFEGKEVLQFGQLRAVDFFGDGSFYLVDTPGHAVGHLAGLARTTRDTFIMMGGDLCHHGGEIRPSELLPLPTEIHLSSLKHYQNGICPGAAFEAIQKSRSRAPNEPFFEPTMGLDIPLAIRTIKKVQEADAQDDVLFIYAHDTSMRGIVDLFPKPANDWKAKGWREMVYWKFLEDFEGALQEQQ